jgi:hypothetical protein
MTKAEGDTFYAPSAEAWQNLPLQAGWASISGYVTPRFRKEGAVIAVEYVGACAAGAASPSVVGTLPVGYRPTNTVRVVGTFTYASAKDGPAFFDIASSGAITFVSLRDTAGGVLAGGSASFVTRFSPT